MKRAYQLSELSKLNKTEFLVSILIFLIGSLALLLLFIKNTYIYYLVIVFIALFIVALSLLIVVIIRRKKGRQYPKGFVPVLVLKTLSFLIIFVLIVINSEKIFFYIFGIIIILYAFVFESVIFLYYFFNLLYYFGLKKYFPFEEKSNNDNNKDKNKHYKKELSKYIVLEKQKIYYNIQIIKFFINILLISFIGLFIFKYVIIKYATNEHITNLDPFVYWVKLQEWVNFSNLLSLASLWIGIYTFVIPIQYKIFDEAKRKKNVKKKNNSH